jgi:hypothetical protein
MVDVFLDQSKMIMTRRVEAKKKDLG